MFERLKEQWAKNIMSTLPVSKQADLQGWVRHFKYAALDRELEDMILEDPALRHIQWPSCDHLDKWQTAKYLSVIKDFCKRFSSAEESEPWFSVCIVHHLEELKCFKMNRQTEKVKRMLSGVHCWKLQNIPPDMLIHIPDMLNFIFSEGMVDIMGEASRESASKDNDPVNEIYARLTRQDDE